MGGTSKRRKQKHDACVQRKCETSSAETNEILRRIEKQLVKQNAKQIGESYNRAWYEKELKDVKKTLDQAEEDVRKYKEKKINFELIERIISGVVLVIVTFVLSNIKTYQENGGAEIVYGAAVILVVSVIVIPPLYLRISNLESTIDKKSQAVSENTAKKMALMAALLVHGDWESVLK